MLTALRFWMGMVLLCASAPLLAQMPASDSVRTEQVRAQLLAHAPQGLQAGTQFWLGLQLAHAPHWHSYWQNPGDSGLPTQLQWQLPPGLHAGEIQWPAPKPITVGDWVNYGYEGKVLLRVPITIAPDFKPQAHGRVAVSPDLQASASVRVALRAQWLVCRRECIPQEGQFALDVPVHSSHAGHAAEFTASLAGAPTPLDGAHTARLNARADTLALRISDLPSHWRGQALQVLPGQSSVVHHGALLRQAASADWQGKVWTARVPLSPERSASPTQMQWLIAPAAAQNATPPVESVWVTTPVQGKWPAVPDTPLPEALAQALATPPAAQTGAAAAPTATPTASAWAWALLGAFVGGLLLNFMPCVFPILALKLLHLTASGTPATQRRTQALAYAAGVVASMLLLGALMLAVRASGEQLGWGFQLQSPAVVTGLALLFALLALNLLGGFEWGTWLPSRLASWQSPRPTVNAALSGLLAVVVASPCSAPFMGASMGVAMQWPAPQALGVFAALGLGMCSPFLLACVRPNGLAWLPKPGAWMHSLRQALAFPLLATVVWLLWVLGQQTGPDAVAWVMALMLLLGFGVWSQRQAPPSRWALHAASLLCVAALWATLPSHQFGAAQAPTAPADPCTSPARTPPGACWGVWSPEAVAREMALGRTVFVDFTAAWCVTCQFNKQTSLSDARVWAAFESRGVTALRADWTRRDPAITQALAALGRSGVPLYAVYAPGRAPLLLPELPSASDIVAALP